MINFTDNFLSFIEKHRINKAPLQLQYLQAIITTICCADVHQVLIRQSIVNFNKPGNINGKQCYDNNWKNKKSKIYEYSSFLKFIIFSDTEMPVFLLHMYFYN